jgi:hypothetical protein
MKAADRKKFGAPLIRYDTARIVIPEAGCCVQARASSTCDRRAIRARENRISVAFLAPDRASFLVGAVVMADGGYSVHVGPTMT